MSHADFPAWISATHFLNILFLSLLARSGIQILSSFPRLYTSDDCEPGRELIKFTDSEVPRDRPHQSLDEEKEWSPLLALPGGLGAGGGLGVGRHWHLFSVIGWVLTGLVYVLLLFTTDEWRRLVPTSWSVFADAAAAAWTYLHFHLAEPPAGMPYNALQQLAYFAVVFLLAPFQIATGAAMSPAVIGRFPWYSRPFGSRQTARTLHFFGLVAFALFVAVHTLMVVLHGIPAEWSHIALASTTVDAPLAIAIGCAGLLVVITINVAATLAGRRSPRGTQVALGVIVDAMQRALSRRLKSNQRYTRADVRPYFWVNGLPPPGHDYQRLAAGGFGEWKLHVGGEIEKPFELSLDDLRAMPRHRQVTKHNCIQGWTGIAEWTGVRLADLIDRAGVSKSVRYVVLYAFDDKGLTQQDGEGYYYETIDLDLARAPQTLLAYEFNGRPLPVEHGAPLRLRVESQLGFKMVKWIRAITFERDYRRIGLGYGGWREDHAYYSRVVGI